MKRLIFITISILFIFRVNQAAINFTGDVSVDFDQNSYMVLDQNGDGDVTCPYGIISTGWDFHALYLHYDRNLDRLYIGLDFAGRICGDADGNGNPSTTGSVLQGLGGQDVANLGNGETAGNPSDSCITGWILKDNVNVREAPSVESRVVSKLYRGDVVSLVERVGNWWKIECNGSLVYVFNSFVSLEKVEKVLSIGEEFDLLLKLCDISGLILATEYDEDFLIACIYISRIDWYSCGEDVREQFAQVIYTSWNLLQVKWGRAPYGCVVVVDEFGNELRRITH